LSSKLDKLSSRESELRAH